MNKLVVVILLSLVANALGFTGTTISLAKNELTRKDISGAANTLAVKYAGASPINLTDVSNAQYLSSYL